MHELSITQNMFDLVMEESRKAGATNIKAINVVIGEMTGVVGDCVSFYLELLSKGTIAEGAVLKVRNVPVRARCRDCKKEFTVQDLQWICPVCGGVALDITGGRELSVESIEVE